MIQVSGQIIARFHRLAILLLAMSIFLEACTPAVTQSPAPAAITTRKIKVIATTTILGDIVRQIGKEAIELSILLPAGSDPHTFEPAPQDVIAVAEADLVFINGAGLEGFLERLLETAGATQVVSASDGVELLQMTDDHTAAGSAGSETADPHVWFNPQNVLIWTQNIERELSDLDPANAEQYAANAEAYRAELHQLDAWIEEQVTLIPPAKRKLVTDHRTFGYFADRYGFEQVGAVIPSGSAAAEPSAASLAALEDAIREMGVQAIFTGTTVAPNLARRVAADTSVQLVTVYTDALTDPGGEAASYL
ncbi:MAG TPA: metal ABC transporter substrate-binding protein, partial [Anaerolineales bacterium]|nr:metal ABC transporter substrate-binding protein [Anaerolineales bacterium]